VVFETGLNNLVQEEAPLLVHLGNRQTQKWSMVRMSMPENPATPSAAD
jgi:hypothetical protein